MQFWTYMVTCADGSHYVGHTDDHAAVGERLPRCAGEALVAGNVYRYRVTLQPGGAAVTKFLVQWRPPKAGCSMMAVNC